MSEKTTKVRISHP